MMTEQQKIVLLIAIGALLAAGVWWLLTPPPELADEEYRIVTQRELDDAIGELIAYARRQSP